MTANCSALRIFGASVIGSQHVGQALPCQDACDYDVFDGAGVIAIADGLGSAARADVGASLAVTTALDAARAGLRGADDLAAAARAGVVAARQALEAEAGQLGCKIRDLACTLVVVTLRADRVAVAHVGDGAVVARLNGVWELLSGPAESGYVNEVTPLTDREWEVAVRVALERDGLSGLLALTDGCQRAALQRTPYGLAPYDDFCQPLVDYARDEDDAERGEREIAALLESPTLAESSEDDKTLVVAFVPR
jgi:hypothetical protein